MSRFQIVVDGTEVHATDDEAAADQVWEQVEFHAMQTGQHAQYLRDGEVLQEMEA